MKPLPKYFPVIIAIVLGLLAVFIYVLSGQNSFDQNLQQLNKNPFVEKTENKEGNKILVHCKNGDQYQIVFQQNQQNYNDLIFSACGPEGAQN